MTYQQYLPEIQNLNLNYLLLAQKLLLQDPVSAELTLGISKTIGRTLENIDTKTLLQLASINQPICQLRYQDTKTLSLLAQKNKSQNDVNLHSLILMASKNTP